MIKEIVEFSKQLEEAGIYERVYEDSKKIDRPIMVIPVKEDLSDILPEEIYFVFERIEEESYFLNGKEIAKIKPTEIQGIHIRGIDEEEKSWQEILRSLRLYSQKLATDAKGSKSIGTNEGTNSYNLLIFDGKFEKGELKGQNNEKYNGDLLYLREGFMIKIPKTYREEVIELGFPVDLNEDEKIMFTKMLRKMSEVKNLEQLWDHIDGVKTIFSFYDEKTKKSKIPFGSILVVLKLPKRFYEDRNIYKEWYDKYLQKKIFKVDNPDKYYKSQCCACGSQDVNTFLPDCFNNMDGGKPFLRHSHRLKEINISICGTCALEIYKFQEYFLNRLHISLFPLFIQKDLRQRTIDLFKGQEKIEKLSFQEVISEIYRDTSVEELDFYLILYARGEQILFFDYITGFHFKMNAKSIFEVEAMIDHYFLSDNLGKNYFADKLDTGNRMRDNIIYSYRQLIFDFVYRAKYSGLDNRVLQDLYLEVLRMHLRQLVSKDKFFNEKKVIDGFDHYLELNKLFKGVLMDTIKKIQESQTINDEASFAYYAGQITYYLLSQSKSDSRTHSLVEPFINVANFAALGIRIEELFNNYKHSISFDYKKFNTIFSALWAFLFDHKEEPFTKELKTLFYAGYFNSVDNIFYKSDK